MPKLKSEGYSPDDTPDEYEKRWPGTLAEIKDQVKDEHEEVVKLGGLYVLGTERHEVPPYRQPAARPFRPSGRSG